MEVIFTAATIRQAAAQLLEHAEGRKLIAFEGDMGAGKTTFIHALCDELGVTDAVGSPTYAIINQYLTGDGQPVYHIDLYRLADETEAISAGVEDCLYSGHYCFVEWPQRADGIFPINTLYVRLEVTADGSRRLITL